MAAKRSTSTINLEFQGKIWPLLGRGIVYLLASIIIIPIAWVVVWFYQWISTNIKLSNGTKLSFEGKAKDIWGYFALLGLLGWLPTIISDLVFHGNFVVTMLLALLLLPISSLLVIQIMRWMFASIKCKNIKFKFNGSYLQYLGWTLLVNILSLTIIGWAWAAVAMQRWIYRNINAGTHKLIFKGTGWGLLWRTFFAILGSLFIIPIPWMVRWLMKWYIGNTVIEKK